MPPKALAILFAALVACCWGLYGPTLSNARAPMKEWGPFKPYVFIGVAYLVIAIVGGAIMMKLGPAVGLPQDDFDYSGSKFAAAKWGFLAGTLGALGAMFLTFAVVKTRGNPALVMPIVFGGAVTVNAIASYVKLSDRSGVNPLMWVGMALVAVGIYFVASHTPHGPAGHGGGHSPAEGEHAAAIESGAAPGGATKPQPVTEA